jgi:hypothetical protein
MPQVHPNPLPPPSHSNVEPSLACIERDIGLKTFFARQNDGNAPSKLRAKSNWCPPLPPRAFGIQVNSFLTKVRGLFTKWRGKQNLTPHQQQLLSSIQENQSVIIAQADKNLGPVGIDVEDYIKLGLEHLLNILTYKILTEAQAARDIQELQEEIYSWTICHRCSLSDNVVNFIRKHLNDAADNPLGYFYLLIKLHRTPISGRPVCSNCGSLPHALGHWVDKTLQPIVQDQALYFKNSAELKSEME